MAFFPGIGAKEGIRSGGPKTTTMGNPPTKSSATPKGMSGPRPMSAAGTSKAPKPKNKASKANPFAPVIRKST